MSKFLPILKTAGYYTAVFFSAVIAFWLFGVMSIFTLSNFWH